MNMSLLTQKDHIITVFQFIEEAKKNEYFVGNFKNMTYLINIGPFLSVGFI